MAAVVSPALPAPTTTEITEAKLGTDMASPGLPATAGVVKPKTNVPPAILSNAIKSASTTAHSSSPNTTYDGNTSLHTPLTSTYPSTIHSLHSPLPQDSPRNSTSSASSLSSLGSNSSANASGTAAAASMAHVRRAGPSIDEALKTPITPPSAYLDFLKCVSPALSSPGSSSAHFSFNGNPASPYPWSAIRTPHSASFGPDRLGRGGSATTPHPTSARARVSRSQSPGAPTSQPEQHAAQLANTSRPLMRANAPASLPNPAAARGPPTSAPMQSPRASVPPTPKLIIPSSPSGSIQGPGSARPGDSAGADGSTVPPAAGTTLSAGALSAARNDTSAVTPRSAWSLNSAISSGTTTPVTIRHVVKRTVTYTRPLGSTARLLQKRASSEQAPTPSGAALGHAKATRPSNLAHVRRSSRTNVNSNVKFEQHPIIAADDDVDAFAVAKKAASDGDADMYARSDSSLSDRESESGIEGDTSDEDVSSSDDNERVSRVANDPPRTQHARRPDPPSRHNSNTLIGDAPRGKRRKLNEDGARSD